MKKILVCGGRNFDDKPLLYRTLDKLCHDRGWVRFGSFGATPYVTIIHGGARGADQLAGEWACRFQAWVPMFVFPANWEKYGRAAGPIRNQQMLDEGKPDVVVAFAGGRGTADMVRRAKAAGIEVIEVAPDDA